jgi:methylated-DNA-[protein]-cysteine S-methyltransferase
MNDRTFVQNLSRGSLKVDGFGRLWLTWSERGLVSIDWTNSKQSPKGQSSDEEEAGKLCDVPERYRSVLQRYFRGEAVEPAQLSVDLRGTEFQIRVWSLLRSIPRGSVRSYAEIAQLAGLPRGARAIGTANRLNPLPIVVPCHRVVRTGLRLGGYSGGLERKRLLLRLEGVRVVSDSVEPVERALTQPLGA